MPTPADIDIRQMLTRSTGRRSRNRLLAAALSGVLAGSLFTPGALPAWAAPRGPGLAPQVEKMDHDGGEVHGKPWPDRRQSSGRAPAPVWPRAGSAVALLPGAAERKAVGETPVRAGDLPVSIARRAGAGQQPTQVRVAVLDRAAVPASWRDGLLVRLTSDAPAGRARVTVDYGGFRFARGGDWASRLRLWRLPSCALATAAGPACPTEALASRNDAAAGNVSAEIPLAPDKPTLLAVAAAPAGSSGDFKATSLAPSASWSSGGSTGDFSWSYPMRVPPAIGALQPKVSLTYSSGSVDGRSEATNNQPSWIGEGFDYAPGFIERRYVACSDDMADSANNTRKTGDLCWRSDNATLNLHGTASELIFETGKGWHMRSEDASKIEKRKGGSNGDDDGEYWEVTSADGTQYFFGRHSLPGQTATTDSTNTVRVYGNHAKEPCHADSFAGSACNQAWRWNLDYVVDVRGNTISYWYDRETNKYAANLDASADVTYVRSSVLTRIDYGTWDRGGVDRSVKPTAQVTFTPDDRCVAECGSHDRHWPDTPWDQECKADATSCDGKFSPTFWSTKRLTKITTRIWDTTKPTPAWQDVDSWTLSHSFPNPGDGSDHAGLWLDSIVHAGHVGGTVTLPPITFQPTSLPNRVLTKTNTSNNWQRIGNIITETGAKIQVTYSLPECTDTSLPSAPHTNTKLCYPVVGPDPYDPDGPDITEWWQKYVVRQVSESDVQLAGGHQAPVKNTFYSYEGTPAWHYSDDDGLVKPKYKTWSQFRGYAVVKVRVGDTVGQQTLTETRYLRGMHGDRLTPSGGTRTVVVGASVGGETVYDEDQLAGMIREQIVYNGTESKPVSKTVNVPWLSPPTATRTVHGDAVTARFTNTRATYRAEALGVDGNRGWRITGTSSEYSDAYGTVDSTSDAGELGVPGDEKCVTYTYNRNVTKNILKTLKRTTTTALACSKAPTSGDDVISDERNFYDGAASPDTDPDYGAVTRTERLKDWSQAGGTVWQTTGQATYDDYGRKLSTTDIRGNTTTTVYTPTAGGPVTSVKTTNPEPFKWQTTTRMAPYWGSTTTTTDPNGRTTDVEYDPLGRVSKVWKLGWFKSVHPTRPSAEYTYTLSPTRSDYPYTTSRTLNAGGGYITSYEIFDGLLRARQTQAPAAAGGGRVVTDTVYDEVGRAVANYSAHAEPGTPSGTLWWEPEWSLRALTRTVYDNANRAKASIFLAGDGVTNLVEKWRTTTAYEGDLTKVTPPDGGTPTTTRTDIQGRTIELRQHTTAQGVDGPSQSTRYTYNRKNKLVKVADTAGNEWTYTFDIIGRQIETTDPDKGTTTSRYNDFDDLEGTTDARGKTLAYTYDQLGRKTGLYDNAVSAETRRAEWRYDKLASLSMMRGQLTEAIRYENGQAYKWQVVSFSPRYQPSGIHIVVPDSEPGLAGTYLVGFDFSIFDGTPLGNYYPVAGGMTSESTTTVFDRTTGLPVRLQTTSDMEYVAGQEYTPYGEPTLTTRKIARGVYVQDATYYDTATRRVTRTAIRPETATGTVSDRSYTYDPAGNITGISETPQLGQADSQCFRHDALRRLTSAWTPGTGATCSTGPAANNLGGPAPYWLDWTFDAVGNRLTETSHAAAGNTKLTYTLPTGGPGVERPHAVTAVKTEAPGQPTITRGYVYDDSGNTSSRPGPSGETQTLTWNTEGRLSSVTPEGGAPTTNVYDTEGVRLIRRAATGTTLYLPGGMEIRRENGTNVATRYYTFGGKVVASRTQAGGLVWLYSDHQGTQQTVVHALTQKVSVRRQLPFGGPRGDQPRWPNQKGFVGGDLDPTGLTHVGAREYDPGLGRFISVDPVMDMADPQQWNPYAYANNSPVTNSDPTGLYNDPGVGGVNGPAGPAPSGGGNGGGGNGGGGGGNGGGGNDGGGGNGGGGGKCSWICNLGKGVVDGYKQMMAAPYVGLYDSFNTIVTSVDQAADGDISWGEAAGNIYNIKMGNDFSMYFLGRDAASEGRAAFDAARRGDWYGVGYHGFQSAHNGGNLALSVITEVAAIKVLPKGPPRSAPESAPRATSRCNSFIPHTSVLMAGSTMKAIKDVKVGDYVLATDPNTGITSKKRVVATILGRGVKNLIRITLRVGNKGRLAHSVVATDHHPFWVPELREWVNAMDLRVGQRLQSVGGGRLRIAAVDRWTESTLVRNFTVQGVHTYYVMAGTTPVLVHNCNTMTVDELANTKPIHGIDPDKAANVRGLSDDELINSFNNPRDGGHVLVGDDGRIWNGHHRINEITNRAADPRSSITGSTRVRVDIRRTEPLPDFW